MKKLAILAIAALVAGSAFADWHGDNAGWWLESGQTGITVGGKVSDLTDWGTGNKAAPDLGTLTDLTVTGLDFNFWANGYEDSSLTAGANLYFLVFDEGGSKLGETAAGGDGLWTTHATWAGGTHDWAIDYTGNYDILADSGMSGVTLEDGKKYTLQVYAKTYGNGNQYISGDNSSNFSATFTYSDPSGVPEPATMSLLGLGALALVLRRKLRK
jgi:hypothetical protein